MANHRRRGAGDGPFGPVRPEHASDGWTLAGDHDEWSLTKSYRDYHGQISGTTRTTCAWRICRLDGTFAREASVRSVQDAKVAADAWVREHLAPE